MRCLGKLLVIWGAVLPAMTYPWAVGFNPQFGLLGSLPHMYLHGPGAEVPYAIVVALGLWMVGLGLTAEALRAGHDRDRLLHAVERLADLKK